MPPPASPLQSLACRWQVIALMLVALARQVSMSAKMRAHGGAETARLIKAQIYSALIELSSEIAAAPPPQNSEDDFALTYLKTVHALLSVMALMCRQIGSDLLAAAEWLAALAGTYLLAGARKHALPAQSVGYLDSS